MKNQSVREYYTMFYGRTFGHNMSDVAKRVDYSKIKKDKYHYSNRLFYVYKLEWGANSNYFGCTGAKPHKRLKQHIWERGLDEDRVKMTIIGEFLDNQSALEVEQSYINENYDKPGNKNLT